MLVRCGASYIQRMQKALSQMNLQLHNVVTDITGVTGMRIIKRILEGERNPKALAALRDVRCKNDEATIARSLQGNYRPEHLFNLRQALELCEFHQAKIADCDQQIMEQLKSFDSQDMPNGKPPADVEEALLRMSGVDLTRIDGIDTKTVLKVLAEIGTDMSRWKSEKHFASWLGLSPGSKISGGKSIEQCHQTRCKQGSHCFVHGRLYAFQVQECSWGLSPALAFQIGSSQGDYRHGPQDGPAHLFYAEAWN